MSQVKNLVLRGAVWATLTRLLVNAIGLVSTIVLARLLVPEDFGLVAIASAAAMIFASATELSLSNALIQHDDPQDDHFHTAFTLNLIRGLILAVLIAALGLVLATAYNDARLFALMAVLGMSYPIGGLLNPRLVVFERRLEFKQWMILSSGEKFAGFCVAVAIAFAFRSYWALVLGVIASQVTRVALSYFLIAYSPRLSVNAWRELMSFSIWLSFGQLVQSLNWRADPLLLGAFLPTKTIGQFSMGTRVVNIVIGELLHPLSQVLFPAFAQLKNEPARLREGYLRAQGLLHMFAIPIGIGCTVIAGPLVLIILGEKWLGVVPIIQFLAIPASIKFPIQINAIAMALGKTRALFMRDVRALCIRVPMILAGLIFGPSLGVSALIGALIGHAVSSLTNSVLNMRLIGQISEVSFVDQLLPIMRPTLASGGMAVCAVVLLARLQEAQLPGGLIVALLICVCVGALVYAGLLGLLWLISGRPNGAEKDAATIASSYLPKPAGR